MLDERDPKERYNSNTRTYYKSYSEFQYQTNETNKNQLLALF